MNVSDVKNILDAPEIIFFLPAINLVYLHATTDFPNEFSLSLVAIVTSAVVYNILTGVPAENSENVRLSVTILLAGGTIIWMLLLVYSMCRLYNSFPQASVIHEALFFSTIALVIVGIVNLFLIIFEDEYRTIF